MKKFISILTLLFLNFSFPIFAEYYNQNDIITVKKLKTMKDDSYALIEGFIVKQISDEKFLFKDETGEIVLDIDDNLMYQLKDIDKNTLVEIYGELDKNIFSRDEFEVKKITIIK